MDLAYCLQCGGSFVKDAETDRVCGDCNPGEEGVKFTKPGYIWSEVVCEIEWLQDSRGDLTHALVAVEDQLAAEYWESENEFTITVGDEVAELIRQVENNDSAERAELDRRLAERDRQASDR